MCRPYGFKSWRKAPINYILLRTTTNAQVNAENLT